MRKKLLYCVIVLMLFASCAGRQKGDIASVRRNDDATFRIDHLEGGGHGTAVVLDRSGYLLTCHHVAFDRKGKMRGLVVNIAVGNQPAVAYPVQVLAYDKGLDLAVLKVDFRFPIAVRLGRDRDAHLLDAVYAVGFPFDLGRMAAYGRIKNANWNDRSRSVKNGLVIDFSDGNGMSGSGVFLARSGDLIGTLHLMIPARDDGRIVSDNRQARVRVAVPVGMIRTFLDRKRIPYHGN